jgi:UDP-N-acetylglucosamine acyltransferase
MSIHPSAIVDPTAELGADVVVHPFTIIEAGVKIGDNCEIGPHAVIRTGTRMGANNRVTVGVVLGDWPQDLKFKGEETYLDIGEGNMIREYVTLHRATGEGNSTVVGSHNLIMAYCHMGHNSRLGDHVMMANSAQVAGHCEIADYAVIGGGVGMHQFCRIGTMAMVGAFSSVRIDVPPYMMVDGDPARPVKPNTVGLKRRGVSAEAIAALRQAFKIIWRSDLNISDGVARVRAEIKPLPEILHLVEFLEAVAGGERGRALD